MLRDPLARRLFWLLAAVCALSFAVLGPHLLYRDLNLDYPFVDGDSHDWIANGLFLAGQDVRWSVRAPLLPAEIAVLDRCGLVSWLPLLQLLEFLLTVLAFYALAASLHPPPAAFVAALLLLVALQGLALEVMADVPAACLILWSAWFFVTARNLRPAGGGEPAAAVGRVDGGDGADAGAERPHRYAWSGLLAGLASLTQEIGLGLPVAAMATLWMRRRRDLRSPWPWIGLLLIVACQVAWWLTSSRLLAARGGVPIDHARLVGFHLSSVPYYLWSLVSLLGAPACVLLAVGLALAVRRAGRRRDEGGTASLFVLLLFAGFYGFFVLLYHYNGKRLLAYALVPAAFLVAEALSPLARRGGIAGGAGFAIVAVATLGGAALPLPETPHDGAWAALWPLPPLAAHVAIGSSIEGATLVRSPGAGSMAGGGERAGAWISFRRLTLADLAGWSTYGRVARAWVSRPSNEPLPPHRLFAAAEAALFLYEDAGDGGGRYRTITRLSNALGKPVRFVPRAALAAYWPFLAVTPVASLTADYRVYLVGLPGLTRHWLLVTPGGHPLDSAELSARVTAPAPVPLGELRQPEALAQSLAEASAVAAYVGRDRAYVALFLPGRRLHASRLTAFYLLFLLRTTELYVIEPHDAPVAQRFLGQAPTETEHRIGAIQVTTTHINSQPTAVLRFDP